MVSGSYLKPDKTNKDDWDIEEFNTAYATRIFPALVPTPKVVNWLDDNRKKTIDYDKKINQAIESIEDPDDEFTMKKLFGWLNSNSENSEIIELVNKKLKELTDNRRLGIFDVLKILDMEKKELNKPINNRLFDKRKILDWVNDVINDKNEAKNIVKNELRIGRGVSAKRFMRKFINLLVQEKQNKEKKKDVELDREELVVLSEKGLFDNGIMQQYYESFTQIGRDPEKAVISGAALVLSDGAILDLPPFCNFQYNVMWIDDFLKFELHNALRHFPKGEIHLDAYTKFQNRRKAPVYKDRVLAGQGNLRPYTLGKYIPTLFGGLVMVAWIKNKKNNEQTDFVKALELALKRGIFEPRERKELCKKLQKTAIVRINEIRAIWKDLKTKTNSCKSFAALWVGGNKEEIEKVMSHLSPFYDKKKWLGWGLLEKDVKEISDLDQLREPVREIIELLIEDICTYIDRTLEWPKFVQSVRAVRNASFKLDMRYEP